MKDPLQNLWTERQRVEWRQPQIRQRHLVGQIRIFPYPTIRFTEEGHQGSGDRWVGQAAGACLKADFVGWWEIVLRYDRKNHRLHAPPLPRGVDEFECRRSLQPDGSIHGRASCVGFSLNHLIDRFADEQITVHVECPAKQIQALVGFRSHRQWNDRIARFQVVQRLKPLTDRVRVWPTGTTGEPRSKLFDGIAVVEDLLHASSHRLPQVTPYLDLFGQFDRQPNVARFDIHFPWVARIRLVLFEQILVAQNDRGHGLSARWCVQQVVGRRARFADFNTVDPTVDPAVYSQPLRGTSFLKLLQSRPSQAGDKWVDAVHR